MNDVPMIVGLGELLWDRLPGGPEVGGAPANFAWHCGQLGADGRVISAVGADPKGRKLLAKLAKRGQDQGAIAVLPEHPTGEVTVTLSKSGQPSYDIRENVAWDFIPVTSAALDLAEQADAVCVGTLAQRSPVSHLAVQELLDGTDVDCLRIFDLNLRQSFYSEIPIRETLTKCDVLKLSDEEWPAFARLLGLHQDFRLGVPELRLKYGQRLVVVTMGAKGSTLFSMEGSQFLEGQPVRVIDTVGAGDAFTAALAIGMLEDYPLPRLHQWASDVAAYVCTQRGATPVLPAELKAEF